MGPLSPSTQPARVIAEGEEFEDPVASYPRRDQSAPESVACRRVVFASVVAGEECESLSPWSKSAHQQDLQLIFFC